MDENKLKFGVGVLVISAIGIGIILTFLFGAFPSVLNRDYTLSVVFPSAEGIGPNTPVVRDGVRIGRVSDIQLQEGGGVLVTLSMDSDQRLSHRYLPRIGSGNFVTGDANLEFVRGDERQLAAVFGADREIVDRPYIDGEFLDYGYKAEGLFEMQDDLQDTFRVIRTAGESIATAGESVNQLAIEVRQVVNGTDSRIDAVSEEAVEALEEFQGAMRDIRAILGNPELVAGLEETMAEFPELLKDARVVLDSTQRTFETFDRVGNQFERVGIAAEGTVQSAQRTVDNVERFTQPLADRSEELVDQVIRSLASLDAALVQVDTFGRTLNNSEGTVRRLLEDEELYWQIRRTVDNIEQASAKIRPIMDDVRIFSDKIARDPRELGVRGAISKRPTGAGLK